MPDGKEGWGTASENLALKDFQRALRAGTGKGEAAEALKASVYLVVAKVWARRLSFAIERSKALTKQAQSNRFAGGGASVIGPGGTRVG